MRAAPASAGRARRARRGSLALHVLAAIAVLVALAGLQPQTAAPAAPGGGGVVLTDAAAGSPAVAVRSVRQLLTPPAVPTPEPTAAPPAAFVAFVLLLAIWPPLWMRSRRSRQAHLLVSAGPGPPSYS